MITVERTGLDGVYEVWTDVDGGFMDGRCIGCDKSKSEALKQAYSELRRPGGN